MASEDAKLSNESFTMNSGNGPHSYARNSHYQKGAIDSAKTMIDETIAQKLDVELLSSLNTFTIADLGCSIGPNTFHAVKNVIEAVELKYRSLGLSSHVLEYQVFFNDHRSNDFNMLFTSLPPERQYFAAGVPGSFYGRLFPRASLHFVSSSHALQILSDVPREILDKNSPAWNKGRIYYTNAPNEVVQAYSAQYAKDMESFLHARAQEIVCGGLMAFLVPCIPDGMSPQSSPFALLNLLGSSLIDMAKMGFFSEDKVDTFNLPIYMTSPQELEMLIERNGYFSIERMEVLNRSMGDFLPNARSLSLQLRVGFEGLIKKHFGSEIIDELFDRFTKKMEESAIFSNFIYKTSELLFILKRKCD